MRQFLLALQFLTVFPVKVRGADDIDLARSLVFFPLVGAVLGGMLWVSLWACFALDLGAFAYAIVPVVLLAALTGGLHLDGLADTADAFYSNKGKEETLAVMRDPHTGSLGAAALVCVLLLKVALLAAVPLMYRGPALLFMCVSARWSLVLSMFSFPYARKEGKASVYFNGINGVILVAAAAVSVLCLLGTGLRGMMALLTVSAFSVLFGSRVKNRIGGMTGDTLGASVELSEIFALLLVIFIF